MTALSMVPERPASFIHPLYASAAGVRLACVAVMDACRELSEAGCQILSAHAITGRPTVCVAPPDAAVALKGALRRRTRSEEVLVSRLPSGVLVQWRLPRRARAGGAA